MPEYFFRLLPAIAAAMALTPASATTYTRAIDSGASAPSQASVTSMIPTFGATYDALTGKFTATALADADSDDACGSADCPAAAAAAPTLATANAQPATAQPSNPRDAHKAVPSLTAASASANWYMTTLVADTYGYNGNNDAFRLAAEAYLPNMPDPTSWAMMFGGMVAIGFLMRKREAPVTEAQAAATTWDGTAMHIIEIRTPAIIKQAKAAAAASTLCCSRQALPGS